MDLVVAFITGLTTGGLGCLAVQSGLLASTLAYQVEQDMLAHNSGAMQRFKPHIAQPIFLFLVANHDWHIDDHFSEMLQLVGFKTAALKINLVRCR